MVAGVDPLATKSEAAVSPLPASSAEEFKLATFLHARHADTLPGLQLDLDALETRIGRPPAPIDPDQVERLAAMQCTDEEIAHFFGVTIRTFQRRKKKADLSERVAQGRDRGKISLRRLQWMTANSGDRAAVVMQIWLGKQILNQKDRVSNEHSGIDGAPIEVTHVRAKLADLLAKRAAGRSAVAAPVKTDG